MSTVLGIFPPLLLTCGAGSCVLKNKECSHSISVEDEVVIQPHPLHDVSGIPHFSRHEELVALFRANTVLLLKRLRLFLYFGEMLFLLLQMKANQFEECLIGQSSSANLLQSFKSFM